MKTYSMQFRCRITVDIHVGNDTVLPDAKNALQEGLYDYLYSGSNKEISDQLPPNTRFRLFCVEELDPLTEFEEIDTSHANDE